MLITIVGGHGKVALMLTSLLVKAGHDVVSMVRNQAHVAAVGEAGATAVAADVERLDRAGIAQLIGGSEALVWSAGAGGGNPKRTYAVDRDAAIRTIDAAVDAGVRRFIMVSYSGSGRDNIPEDNPFHPYSVAKAAADAHLREAALNWTIVAPGQLTGDEATGRIEAGPHVLQGATSRANVARVIAEAVPRSDLGGVNLWFRDGEIPIAEALDAARDANGQRTQAR